MLGAVTVQPADGDCWANPGQSSETRGLRNQNPLTWDGTLEPWGVFWAGVKVSGCERALLKLRRLCSPLSQATCRLRQNLQLSSHGIPGPWRWSLCLPPNGGLMGWGLIPVFPSWPSWLNEAFLLRAQQPPLQALRLHSEPSQHLSPGSSSWAQAPGGAARAERRGPLPRALA